MANFGQLMLTASGVNALLRAQGGAKLQFSKIAMGKGTFSGNTYALTSLVDEVVRLEIIKGTLNSDKETYTIEAYFDNQDISEGFQWREIGVFIKDSNGNDVLYAYSNAGQTFDYIPATSDERYSKYIRVATAVSNVSNVTIVIPEGTVYVDYETFAAAVSTINLSISGLQLKYTSDTSVSTALTVYISTTGDDSNSGLTETNPMATIKGAIRKYAQVCKMLEISLGAGTYNEDIGVVALDQCLLIIKGRSTNCADTILNITTAAELYLSHVKLAALSIKTVTNSIIPIKVMSGVLHINNAKIEIPTASTEACVGVYDGASAFIKDCVLNAGTAETSIGVYGEASNVIKAIGCTSERKIGIGYYANYGATIEYEDGTITATNETKVAHRGWCKIIDDDPRIIYSNDNTKYRWGVDDGGVYLEELEAES